MSKTSFKGFIQNILRVHGKLNEANIKKYTGEEYMKVYKNAFTHYSFDRKSNYERLEFVGDGLIDSVIVVYVRERFPEVKREGVLARLKIILKCGKNLGKFGHEMNFFKWTRFNPAYGLVKKSLFHTLIASKEGRETFKEEEVRDFYKNIDEEFKKEYPEEVDEYISLMEDVFEAFIGAVVTVVDSIEPRGVAYAVVYNIVSSLLDRVSIKLNKECLMDVKSRLKEVYYNKVGDKDNKIDINRLEKCSFDEETRRWTCSYLYYPQGLGKNAKILGSGIAKSKDLAKKYAGEEALQTVFKMGFKETPLKIK